MIATDSTGRHRIVLYQRCLGNPAGPHHGNRDQSGHRRRHRRSALRQRRRRRSRRPHRARRLPEVARSARGGPRPGALSLSRRCSINTPTSSPPSSPARTARPSTTPALEVRRIIQMVEVACGMPSLMMGDSLNDVAARHRLQNHPPAHRRLRRHHALQLPRHGADVDVPVRHRLRQHVRPEALGKSAADADPRHRTAARCRTACRRVQPDPRRQGERSMRCCIIRWSRPSRFVGSTPGGQVHLHHRRRRRQARAGAGRRQESPGRHARCRYAEDRRSHHRLGLRRRRRALPGRQRAGPGGRCRRSAARSTRRAHQVARRRRWHSTPASRWARW